MEVDAIWSMMIFLALVVLEAVLQGFLSALNESQVDNLLEKTDDEDVADPQASQLHLLFRRMRQTGPFRAAAELASVVIGVLVVWDVRPYVFHVAKKLLGEGKGVFPAAAEWVGIAAFYVIVLAVYVLLSYLLPGKYARKSPVAWVKKTWRIVWGLCMVMLVPAMLAQGLAHVICKMFGDKYDAPEESVTEQEIITMVNEGHEQGVLEAEAAEMITNIFEYGDKQAEDIMTHRIAIHSLTASMTLQEALQEIATANYSRFPVCGEDMDDIIGILHMKEAIVALQEPDNIKRSLRDIPSLLQVPLFIPQTRKIDDLLKDMQKQKIHMVIVLDEYGQTSGLITMEDILEEIVGNIMDEYDEEEDFIRVQEDGS